MTNSCKFKEKLLTPELSIIVPFFNEEDNILLLYDELSLVLEATGQSYELIFINDGSYDKSIEHLRRIAETDAKVLVVLDLGEKNQKLIDSYPSRRAYLYDEQTDELLEITSSSPEE